MFLSVVVLLIFIFGGIYLYSNHDKSTTSMEIYEEKLAEENSIVSSLENIIIPENTIGGHQQENILQTNEETELTMVQETIDEKPKKTNEKEEKQSQQSFQSTQQAFNKGQKPPNKDFLFTDGYNMENVTKYAIDYLKSSNYPGECLPLKDEDGVYIGMRVIFY